MAAPMALRILRQVSRAFGSSSSGSLPALRLLVVHKPQVRLVAARSSLSAPLDGIIEQEVMTADETTTTTTTTTAPTTASEATRPKTASAITISHERARQTMLLLQQPDQPPDARILKVAIIGSPNAGKSTLINRLMGQRVCSVSSKVHTTQTNALAVLTVDSTQIVLLDTPGMVNHKQGRKHHLARSLLVDPKNSLFEADVGLFLSALLTNTIHKFSGIVGALVLVDASNQWTRKKISNEILLSLKLHPRLSSVLVLNKVDLISAKRELFELTAKLTEGYMEGQQFTLDDRTARHLGKVDTRPMLSHKYKPRLPTDQETSLERTEPVDSGVEDLVEQADDDRSSVNDRREGNMSSEEVAETDSRHSDISENKSEPTLDDMRASPSVGGRQELPPTLQEYISTLERFSSESLDFDEVPHHPPNEPVEADDDDTKSSERAGHRKLLREVNRRSGWEGFGAVFMVSALDGEGLEDLKEHLVSKAVPGNWDYHQSVVTNLSPEEIVREAIREKLLEYLPQEVPYSITQKNELWATETSGRLRVVQVVACHKKSHVKLLMNNIGKIAREAEQELMSAFQCDVYLTLRIMRR